MTAADPEGPPPLWNTAVRVVGNIRARTREEATGILSAALDRAGFDVIADDPAGPEGDYVSTGAAGAEPGTWETVLPGDIPGTWRRRARAGDGLPAAPGAGGGTRRA